LPAVIPRIALGTMAALLVWGIVQGRFFQLRAAEWRYPAGAAEYLRSHRITARMFNTYEYGGYLLWRLWPVQKTFIDGRALSETVYQDYRKIVGLPPGDPVRAATLARHGIGLIVMNTFEYTSGVLYPLALALAGSALSEWKLVYEDAQAMVFLREAPPSMPVLERRRVIDHLEAECRLHVERNPEFPLCARTLGDLFLRAGDRERARRSLALYLEHAEGDDRAARDAYQKLLFR
jgi:hypothetical protein